jgi:hypothetical protein
VDKVINISTRGISRSDFHGSFVQDGQKTFSPEKSSVENLNQILSFTYRCGSRVNKKSPGPSEEPGDCKVLCN